MMSVTIITAITPTITQKAVVLVTKGKSTFIPKRLATTVSIYNYFRGFLLFYPTTVSGSMMVEK